MFIVQNVENIMEISLNRYGNCTLYLVMNTWLGGAFLTVDIGWGKSETGSQVAGQFGVSSVSIAS